MRIAERMFDLRTQEGASDVHIWEWLSKLVEKLGEDGMSSEESDEDTHGSSIEAVLRPRIMDWQREMGDTLQILDNQRHIDTDIFTPRGAKPVTRIRNPRNKRSTRRPVPELPRSLYNDKWLNEQTDDYIERSLKISNETFPWKRVEASRC